MVHWVPEIGDPGQLRRGLFEKLKPFSAELFLDRERLPGHGAAGMCKADDHPGAHRIGHDKNDRDRQRGPLGSKGGRDASGDDDLDL